MNRLYAATAWLCLALMPLPAHASMEISGTRVIYPGSAGSVTVQTTNRDTVPYLVKVWVDREDTEGAENSDVPFVVTPPMSRVEAGDSQALRLARIAPIAAQDRESVFWLNVLAIPPHAPETIAGKNILQFAVRTRIKIFFRPPGLPGSPHDAPAALAWRAFHARGEWFLECSNPTPFHVSMAEVAMDGFDAIGGLMVAPLSSLRMRLGTAPGSDRVFVGTLSTVNDHGAVVERPLRVVSDR